MEEIIYTIGIIGSTALAAIFAVVSCYLSLRRRGGDTNGDSREAAGASYPAERQYREIKRLFEESREILQKAADKSSSDSDSK